jgi:hypothetical protein
VIRLRFAIVPALPTNIVGAGLIVGAFYSASASASASASPLRSDTGAQALPAADFGSPPAGEYPILYRRRFQTDAIRRTPVFIEAGWLGDKGTGKLNAPSDYSHNAVFVGGGLHF